MNVFDDESGPLLDQPEALRVALLAEVLTLAEYAALRRLTDSLREGLWL